MARSVEKHRDSLSKLQRCRSEKKRLELLEQGGKPLQLCLRECCINVMNGNVMLTKGERKALHEHKDDLRALKNKVTFYKKRLEISQKGGFLPALIAPVLAAVVAGLIKKK